MYSAETTIVDVKQTGESEYTLSMTAKDLYVAAQSGDVLRRHDVSESDKAPEKKYVALSGVKFAEATGRYTFTFASGDVFESASDTAYPTAESVSDETGGGSGGGGGVLVVHDVDGTLDKTWEEISEAFSTRGAVIDNNAGSLLAVSSVEMTKNGLIVKPAIGSWQPGIYTAPSIDGYPALS